MNEILGLAYGLGRALWRRRWLAIAAAWLVALPAWFFVLQIPDRYEAVARVFVDARTPLRPVLEGIAIETDFDSQLALVSQQLLARPQMRVVARDLLGPTEAANPAAVDALVNELREDIQISSVSSTGDSQNTLYTIAYENVDRDKSLKVVQGLVDKLAADTHSGNSTGAAEVQTFLDRQIAEKEVELRTSEQQLADFKTRNMGQIPGQGGDLITRFDAEQAGLQRAETEVAVSKGRKAKLEEQLASTRQFLLGTSGGNVGGVPDVTQRRQQAEQELAELLLKYTDRHPQVTALRETIATLKQTEERELKVIESGGTGTGAIRSSPNPQYLALQAQLSQVEVEIAANESQARQHGQEIARLRKYVNMAPGLEQEYASLTRDSASLKSQYDMLVAQRQKAGVSDDAAQSGLVRFEVIDPPAASSEPVSPKRPLMFIAVLVLALGCGTVLALIPQVLAPTFDDVGTLKRKLGLPVLGTVSRVYSADQRIHQKWQIFRVACAAGSLVAVAAALSVAGNEGARMLRVLMT